METITNDFMSSKCWAQILQNSKISGSDFQTRVLASLPFTITILYPLSQCLFCLFNIHHEILLDL